MNCKSCGFWSDRNSTAGPWREIICERCLVMLLIARETFAFRRKKGRA